MEFGASSEDIARTCHAPPQPGGLDERDRQILAFERQWWKYAGSKEQAVHDLFGLSATRYYHCLLYTSPSPRDRTRSRMPSSA